MAIYASPNSYEIWKKTTELPYIETGISFFESGHPGQLKLSKLRDAFGVVSDYDDADPTKNFGLLTVDAQNAHLQIRAITPPGDYVLHPAQNSGAEIVNASDGSPYTYNYTIHIKYPLSMSAIIPSPFITGTSNLNPLYPDGDNIVISATDAATKKIPLKKGFNYSTADYAEKSIFAITGGSGSGSIVVTGIPPTGLTLTLETTLSGHKVNLGETITSGTGDYSFTITFTDDQVEYGTIAITAHVLVVEVTPALPSSWPLGAEASVPFVLSGFSPIDFWTIALDKRDGLSWVNYPVPGGTGEPSEYLAVTPPSTLHGKINSTGDYRIRVNAKYAANPTASVQYIIPMTIVDNTNQASITPSAITTILGAWTSFFAVSSWTDSNGNPQPLDNGFNWSYQVTSGSGGTTPRFGNNASPDGQTSLSGNGKIMTFFVPANAANGTVFTLTAVGSSSGIARTMTITINTSINSVVTTNPTGPGVYTLDNSTHVTLGMQGKITPVGGAPNYVPSDGYWKLTNPAGQGTLGSWSHEPVSGKYNQLWMASDTWVYRTNNTVITQFGTNELQFIPFANSNAAVTDIQLKFIPGGQRAGISIDTVSLPAGTVGVAYDTTLAAHIDGSDTVDTSIVWGEISSIGLTLNSAGRITGIPTQAFTGKILITAFGNVSGAYDYKNFDISILPSTGGPTLTLITPNSCGPISGGISVDITGTHLQAGDKFFLADPNTFGPRYEIVTSAIVPLAATGIAPSVPSSGMYELQLDRGGATLFTLHNAFSYGTIGEGTANIISFNPTYTTAVSGLTSLVATGENFTAGGSLWIKPPSTGVYGKCTSVTVGKTQVTATLTPTDISVPGFADIVWKDSSDNAPSSVKTWEIKPTTLTLTVSGPTTCERGHSYSPLFTLVPVGGIGPFTYSIPSGSLPSGSLPLSLHLVGNVVQGTVDSNASTSVVTFRVYDTKQSGVFADLPVTITVVGGNLSINETSPLVPSARIGQAYDKEIAISGGTSPYVLSIEGDNLPPVPLAFVGTRLVGTPTTGQSVGAYNFTLRVTDSSGPQKTITKSFTLNLLAALVPPVFTNMTPVIGSIRGTTQVTITGNYFQQGASVYFGNVLATGVSITNSSTTITCNASAQSAGNVSVKIVNPDGGQVIIPVPFTYVDAVAPNLILVDKPDGPFAGGRSIKLSGTGFSSECTVKIGSQPATSVVFDPVAGTLTCTTPALLPATTTPQVVAIIITNSAGVSTTPGAYTYRPAPQINAVTPNIGPSSGGGVIYISGANFFSRNGKKPTVMIGNYIVPDSDITLIE